MFRYKKSVPVSYERQGYVYFKSLCYKILPEREQQQIVNACVRAAGEHYQALFQFVTSEAGAEAVCQRHHISRSTLERAVRRYYEVFPVTG